MAGIGPRVGGAHVDVNLKFGDTSLGQVGKQIHKQLSTLNKDLAKVGEQNQKLYRGIGQNSVSAWRAFMGTVVAGAPLIGGAISGVAGTATVLGGAIYSLGQSSAALLPIFTSLGVAGLTLKIGMRGFAEAVSEVDPKRLELLLSTMPKSMANAVMATRKLSNEMRAAVWPKLFAGLSEGIDKLRNTGVIQRGLGLMADQLNGLAKSVLNYANSRQGVKTLNEFFANNAKVFGALSKVAVPFLDGFLRLVNALSPAAIRLAGYITDVAKSFQKWTKGEGFAKRIDDAMKSAQKTAGFLWRILGNLGSAIMNIFNIANPSTNTFLQMLEDVTQRFQEWTESAGGKNAIAEWAATAVDMMRQVGHTIEAIWPVIVQLADPRVFASFLKTVEGAFELLNKLPLEKMVNAFLKVSEALQPVSSFFLALIIAGAAFNIMLGGLIGQLGGVVSVLGKFLQFKIIANILKNTGGGAGGAATKVGLLRRAWEFLLKIITKVKSAFSTVVGFFTKTGTQTATTATKVSKLAGAFKPVMSILARFAKFAGWVGIAVWIGTIIAGSEKLQAKFGELWGAFKGVFSQLGESFAEIGKALKPLAPVADAAGSALGFIFDILDKVMELILGFALDAIIFGFKSLAKVIEGLGHIIAGLINVLVGLFTLDFGKVWEGLKQMASGIVPLLQGMFGLFVTFFAPARLAKIGLGLVKGLGSGIVRAIPGILAIVGRFLGTVIKFFATLPFKLLALGVRAIVALGRAVITKGPSVLLQMGKLYVGIVKWILKLPGRLLQLGVQAITKLGSAVVKGTPKVLSAAGRIVSGVIQWIAKLPGRLLQLGGQAISKLTTAIRNGLGSLKAAATDVVEAVVNIIKGLPGKLLSLGSSLLNAGKTLGGKILEGIRSGITAIGDMAGSVASSLKSGINSAIGLPKDLSFSVLGKKIGFTIPGFEKGGITPGGLIAVGEGGPELMAPPRGSRIYSNAESKKMMNSGLPKRVVLRIGDRDFIAYVEELADNRINAADNLAWQGT
jgi:hypothetical protein